MVKNWYKNLEINWHPIKMLRNDNYDFDEEDFRNYQFLLHLNRRDEKIYKAFMESKKRNTFCRQKLHNKRPYGQMKLAMWHLNHLFHRQPFKFNFKDYTDKVWNHKL